jgi:Ribosomal RNA adenine dimethylase
MNKQNRTLQAMVGHLVDLYKISTFDFYVPHSYTKFRAIKAAKKKLKASTFIETGTYLGVTTKRCAPHFDKVFTIELDKNLAEQAAVFLSNNQNVKVLQGDVLVQLPEILNQDVDNVLVFLDAHFSKGITACGDLPEPAIEELIILSKFSDKISGIIIDDFRLFGTEPGFPSKSSVFQSIEQLFPRFDVTVALDQILILKKNT